MLLQSKWLLEINSKENFKKVNSSDFYHHLNISENNVRLGKTDKMASKTIDSWNLSKFWVL